MKSTNVYATPTVLQGDQLNAIWDIRWCELQSLPLSWELKEEQVKLKRNSNSSNWKWLKCLITSQPFGQQPCILPNSIPPSPGLHFPSLLTGQPRFALANGNLFLRNAFDLKYDLKQPLLPDKSSGARPWESSVIPQEALPAVLEAQLGRGV